MSNVTLKTKAAYDLPSFVRDDYKTFVAFISAYHAWLDANQANIQTLVDIDTTLESFIKNFRSEVDYRNIQFPNVDERFLIRHIKKLYLSKGTEESYKTLFKLLFNKDLIIKYPEKLMLKASDGKWEQLSSIFVEVVSGNAMTMNNKIVTVTNKNTDRKISVTVETVKLRRTGGGVSTVLLSSGGSGYTSPTITITGDGSGATGHVVVNSGVITAILIDTPGNNYTSPPTITINGSCTTNAIISSVQMFMMPDIYECNIDKNYFGSIDVGDSISFGAFQGKILPTINSFEIIDSGKNFRLGQTFDIDTVFGKGATVKVTKLNSDKGVAELKFIKYGYGYVSDFETSNVIPPNISQSTPYEGFTSSLFNHVGNFTSGTLYNVNDVAYDTTNSTYYRCILSYTSNTTAPHLDGTHWVLYTGTEETRLGSFVEFAKPDPSGGYVLKETLSTTPAYDFIWSYPATYALNVVVKAGNNFYKVTTAGADSNTMPTHTSGTVTLGSCAFLFLDSSDLYALDYAGELLQEFYSSNKYKGNESNGARIKFKLGSVCKYPGHYINSDGMSSDANKIQDSFLYQKYSYIIQADEKLEQYKDVVKSFVHPAGTALFGEYSINNELSAAIKLTALLSIFSIRHADAITAVQNENSDNSFALNTIVSDDSCALYNIQTDWTNIFDPDADWIRNITTVIQDSNDQALAINVDTPGTSDNTFWFNGAYSDTHDSSSDDGGGVFDVSTIIQDPLDTTVNADVASYENQLIVSDASNTLYGTQNDWTNILDPLANWVNQITTSIQDPNDYVTSISSEVTDNVFNISSILTDSATSIQDETTDNYNNVQFILGVLGTDLDQTAINISDIAGNDYATIQKDGQTLVSDDVYSQDYDINSSVIFTIDSTMGAVDDQLNPITGIGSVTLNVYVDPLQDYVENYYVSAPDQSFTT